LPTINVVRNNAIDAPANQRRRYEEGARIYR